LSGLRKNGTLDGPDLRRLTQFEARFEADAEFWARQARLKM
jgi:hypothetical protein